MHRVLALALALYSYYSYVLIRTNLPRLPTRIPTHFNSAGEPNGWSSPDTLWMLLVVQVVTSALLLVIPLLGHRFPQTVNLGWRKLSDYTPEQRERIMPLLQDMMGYMSLLFSLFFTFLIAEFIRVALSPHPRFQMAWPIGLLLAGNAVVVICYLRRINRAAAPTPSDHAPIH